MKENIANWGNYPRIKADIYNPGSIHEVQALVASHDNLLARGNGRCYGDSALNDTLVSMLGFNKFLDFNESDQIIECQSGVLLSDILDFTVPRGFFLSVTPGTKLITVGGAIASDVHGKNHHVDGCFSNCVISFHIINQEGKLINCSREENSELFWNTAGGMGLTGIIIDARLKLKPVESAYIRQEKIKARNLDEIMDLFEMSEKWTYSVAWIDCLKKGEMQGRSIMMRGEHALKNELSTKLQKNPLHVKKKPKLNVPFMFPSWILNSFTVKAFNFLFYNKQLKKEVHNIIDYDTFFYPLDSINNWNRIYGKSGFSQYQFVFPKNVSKNALKEILTKISDHNLGSFLVVLKLFGKNEPLAKWSFPMEGYTLALDFKIQKGLRELINELDEIVLKYGGHLYLTKDSISGKKMFNIPSFKVEKFISHQYKRLIG